MHAAIGLVKNCFVIFNVIVLASHYYNFIVIGCYKKNLIEYQRSQQTGHAYPLRYEFNKC